jgi:hypothetical protein
LSSNLRNQQYCFKNQKLSKEAYQEAIREYNLGSYSGFDKSKNEFNDLILNKSDNMYTDDEKYTKDLNDYNKRLASHNLPLLKKDPSVELFQERKTRSEPTI